MWDTDDGAHDPYRPHPLSRNGHVASFFGYMKLPVRLRGGARERLALPDGGQLVLHWWRAKPTRADARPVALLIHGINNSSTTPYLQHTMQALEAAGFVPVTLNMRGHGHGNEVSSGRLYQARADDDVAHACKHIRQEHPHIAALYGIGFSMGANQLLCFLATSNARGGGAGAGGAASGARLIDAAVSVSNPFDLAALSEHFKRGVPVLYTALIAQPLKLLVWQGRQHLRALSWSQFLRGMTAASVETFDENVQVPVMGLSSAAEYYSISSSRHVVESIDVPTLVMHAKDDPLVPMYAVPLAELQRNPHITPVVTARGGHIGWHTGYTGLRQRSWSDALAIKFLCKHLQGLQDQCSNLPPASAPLPSKFRAKL